MSSIIRSTLSAFRHRPGFRQILRPFHAVWRAGVNLRGLALRPSLLRRAASIPAVAQGDEASLISLVDATSGKFSGYIWAAQMPKELRSLLEIVGSLRPRTFLEIGTAGGGTLFAISRVVDPRADLLSVDLPGGLWGGGYPRWKTKLYQRMALPSQKVHLIRGDSHSPLSLQKVKDILAGRVLDAIFIDADHYYAGVKADFEMYSPLVRPGGIVAFHDIIDHPRGSGGDVPRYWNELRKSYKNRELIEDPDTGYGIGVLFL